jgi:hypothetical protein
VRPFNLSCPFCARKIRSVTAHEATPHRGDFFCCPACWGVSVLRDRDMNARRWCLTKPVPREAYAIAHHDGVHAILRSYEIARFGNGVSAL